MQAERLVEAAAGRACMQLHDAVDHLPHSQVKLGDVAILAWTDAHGWAIRWRGPRPTGRLALVVRAYREGGRALRSASPFADRHGEACWVVPVTDEPAYLPWLGLDAEPSITLGLSLVRMRRGPAIPLGTHRITVPGPPGQAWDPFAWLDPLLILACAVIHADGEVQQTERRALRDLTARVGLPRSCGLDAILLRPTPASLREATASAALRLGGWGRRTLLEELARISVVSGSPGHAERLVLREIANHLGAPPGTVERLLEGWRLNEPYVPKDTAEAWALLGLAPGSSQAALKAAWRRQVSLHHPDRLVGASEEAIAVATHQTSKINEAYRHLRATTEHSWTEAPPRQAPQTPEPSAPSSVPQSAERSTTMIAGLIAVALASSLFGLLWQSFSAVERATPPPPISAEP